MLGPKTQMKLCHLAGVAIASLAACAATPQDHASPGGGGAEAQVVRSEHSMAANERLVRRVQQHLLHARGGDLGPVLVPAAER
jgi:hypothetical protein